MAVSIAFPNCLRSGAFTTSRFILLLALALGCLPFSSANAQDTAPAKVGELIRSGLGLPSGQVKPGRNRRVKVRNHVGALVTGLIHCEVGDSYVIMMPDGKLASVESRYTNPTNEPFAPGNRATMTAELKRTLGKEFQATETKNHLFMYNCSEAFQKKSAEILDAVHDGVFKHFKELGFTVFEPRVPLVVIIFRTEAEFAKFGEVAEGVKGYYSILSNYIVFYEESEVESVGISTIHDVLVTVAHEGVHQTLANIGVQPRLSIWPAWVTEGMAEFYSPTTDETPIRWKGTGEVNDIRMVSLEHVIKRPERSKGALTRQLVLSHRLDSMGYASSWGLVHFLNKVRPASFLEYVRALSLREPLLDPVTSSGRGSRHEAELELFNHYFGRDFADIEGGMFQHLRKLPFKNPLANLTHFVAIMEFRVGEKVRRIAIMSDSEDSITRWRDETWAKLTSDQRATGKHYIKMVPNRAEAEKYANRWLKFVGI